MPKLKYNPKTGQMEPEVMNYGKTGFQAPTADIKQFVPYVDQEQMIRKSQQERSQGMPTAANDYAPRSSGDPFMDKIMGILASGAPAVTNTDEFQQLMPTAYAGNQNLQDLQNSYEQRYRDYQIVNSRPGYTDAEIDAYMNQMNTPPAGVAVTDNSTQPTVETKEVDTLPYANPVDVSDFSEMDTMPYANPVASQPVSNVKVSPDHVQVTDKQVTYSQPYDLNQTVKDARSGSLLQYTDPTTGIKRDATFEELIRSFLKGRYPETSKF